MRYSGRLYSYLRVRTQGDQDAADLTQQVFVKAFNGLPRYRERGLPFGAWLFRIARNLVVDVHRRQKDTVSWDLLPETAQAVQTAEVETSLLHQEDRTRIYILLNHLPRTGAN
jgi:RNA polymerase sigma-70 factor (ECF subfamily)